MPRSLSVVTSASNACRSVWPPGGKESSAVGTQFLTISLTRRQRTLATLVGVGSAGRHRANRVEQVTQCVQPLGGRTGLVQRDLPTNASRKGIAKYNHHS